MDISAIIKTEIESGLRALVGPLVQRELAKALGVEAPVAEDPDRLVKSVAPSAVTVVMETKPAPKKPAKRRAAAKTGKGKATATKTRQAAAPGRGGPMPGSVADQIVKALTDGPLTEPEFGEVLARIDGTEEAKRQAIARLAKSGRVNVQSERGGRTYRLGSTDARPTNGE